MGGGSMGNMGMGGGMGGGMGSMGSINSMGSMSGMGNMGGMGGNMNAMSMANMGGIRPQGNINPAQLMGMSGGGGGMGGIGMSPTQLLQQQQQRMSNMGQGGMGGGMASMNPMSSNNMMSNSMNPMSMNQAGMGNMGNMGGMGNMSPMGQNPMQNSMNQGNMGGNMGSIGSNYQSSGQSSMSSPTTEPIARPGTSMSMHSNSGGGGFPGQGMGGMGGGNSMNMGGMGSGMTGAVNASSPPSSQGHPQASSHPQNMQSHGSQSLHGQSHGQQHSPSGPQSGTPFQGNIPNAQTQAMLASAIGHLGYSNDQFRGLPPSDRQIVLQRAWQIVGDRVRSMQAGNQTTGMGAMPGQGHTGSSGQGQGQGGMHSMQANQGQMHMPNHNQGHQQQQPLHERPPSSSSTHSHHEMMPPPRRPGTSMSMSRPGTAMGMGPPPGSRPGTSQGVGQPGMGGSGRSVSGSAGPPSTGRASVPPGSPNLGTIDAIYPQLPQTPTTNQTHPPTPKMGGSSSSVPSPTRSTMLQTPIQQNNSMPQIPVNGMVTAGMTPQGMVQNMMGRSGSASSLMGANPMGGNMSGMGGMNAQGPMNAQSSMSQGPPTTQRHGSMPPPQTPQTPTHPQGPQLSNQTPQRNQTPQPPNQRQSSLPPPGSTGKMGTIPPNRMTLPMPGSNIGGSIGNMNNPSMESLNSLNTGEQASHGPQPNGQIPVVKQGSVPPPATPTMPQPSSNQSNTSQAPSTTTTQAPNTSTQPNTSQSTQPNQNGSQPAPSNAPVQTRLQPPPPLPSSVSLNPTITRVTPVPVVGSDKTIPQLSQEEIENIKKWIKIDEAYEGSMIREGKDGEKELGIWKKQKERMTKEIRDSFGHIAPGAPPVPAADGLDRAALNAGAWWERGGVAHGKWFNPSWEWWEARYASFSGRPVEKRFDVRYPGQWARHVKQKDAQQGINQGSSRGRHGRDAGGKDNKAVRREGLRVPRRLKPEDVDMPEELVPIRLEFDVDHHKMRDTFVWNLNDPVVSPESFAQSLVEDYGLTSSYHSQIVKQIQDQLSDYKAHSAKYTEDGDPLPVPAHELEMAVCKGIIGEKESKWWEGWRKRLRGKEKQKERKRRKLSGNTGDVNDGDDESESITMVNGVMGDEPMRVDEMKVDETTMRDDLRILIKIDIIVGSVKLDDQFEWDIDNVSSSPETFAEIYAQDLGLSGEFKTAIAHSIREQVQTYQKSLYLVGRPTDGSAIQDEDLRQSFLPILAEAARAYEQVINFTPRLDYLSDGELDRNEKERDKDYKRRKRNTRGRRGVNLPDREPIRTCRTPAVGFNDTGEAEGANASGSTGIMPSTTRRAAAAAASLTIANMVASENGSSPIMGQAPLPGQVPSLVSTPQPQPPPPPQPKKPIPKGLFKPPPVPSDVLKARAKVPAPTPSTAVDGANHSGGAPESSVSVGPGVGAPKGKAVVISAKRAKELEREAKEKEFADGQHANYIDGVWHCSNCGCPESIAVGRRKGPLGDKSQCGTCGKYWHRHRRPRPVEYNTDPDFHLNQRDSEVLSKSVLTAPKRKGRPPGSGVNASAAATPEPATPLIRRRDLAMSDRETPSRRQSTPISRRQSPPVRAASPALSSASSASESPLALKVNGSTPARGGTSPRPPPPNSSSAISPRPSLSEANDAPSSEVKEEDSVPASAPPSTTGTRAWPPQWLTAAMEVKQSKYPNDNFEVVLRKMAPGLEPEWRIKCTDCPGKLYKPGPGETLSNFEMHLTNRKHRQRVDDRMKEEEA
ncbi:SNF5-domain-containing protein [Marasmius fiardii PR-910]|nr:SNF5-domain-containing protein [Marasmius fiardii PR-910]